MSFEFDPEKLKQETEEANRKRAVYGSIGGALDALGSRQGAAEILLGMQKQKSNAGDGFRALAGNIEDPAERQAKVYENYMRAKNAEKADRESKISAEDMDANSERSKSYADMISANFPQLRGVVAGKSAAEVQRMMPLLSEKIRAQTDFDNDMKKLKFSKDADMQKFTMERGVRQGEKLAEDRKARETIYGVARTPDDAKKLKEASELKKKLDAQLSELLTLRESFGGEVLNRDAVGRAKQLASDLLLTKKNLESLGVLSQSDKDIVNDIIPSDPLQFNVSNLWGNDPVTTKLEALKSDIDRDFKSRLENRIEGYQPEQQATNDVDKNAVEWALQNPNDARSARILKANGVQFGAK